MHSFRGVFCLGLLLLLSLSRCAAQQHICDEHGTVPSECPHDYIWNTITCQYQCKPHCVSNEGNFVRVNNSYHWLCNSCTCKLPYSTCTRMGCNTSVCYDDQGQPYQPGQTVTRECKTATCSLVDGTAGWTWFDPSKQQAPECAYGNATYNETMCQWDCPSTCSNGSQPTCLIQPCALTLCNTGMICVDNYCPNYPVDEKERCTATCVTPVKCFIDPCQVADGQPSKCETHQVCQADYRFGCGFTCQPDICTYNNQTYHINDTFPATDGCNQCTCTSGGQVLCTLRSCPYHNTTTPPPTCLKACIEDCVVGKSCQPDEHGCVACRNITTTSPPCVNVCAEDCIVGTSCQGDSNGCVACRPSPTSTPSITCTYDNMTYQVNDTRPVDDGCNVCSCMESGQWICTLRPIPCDFNSTTSPPTTCPQVCVEACVVGSSCQPDENGCVSCQPTPSVTCTYNNMTYQINDTREAEDGCNTCSCMDTGDWICTLMGCPVPTTSIPTTSIPTTSPPTTSCPACTMFCVHGTRCVMSSTCKPSCEPSVCSNSCFPVHCPSGTTCQVDSGCGTSCVSRAGVIVLRTTFTMTWRDEQATASTIVAQMYTIASNAGILSVFVINVADVTRIGTKWTITIGIKGTSHEQQTQALTAFFTTLSSNGINTPTSKYAMDQTDHITTTEQAMNTQTCADGTSLSVDQTCPTMNGVAGPTSSATNTANSSSSSNKNSLVTWVVPIVIGVVFLIICGVGIVIIRDRRHNDTIKTFDNTRQQHQTQPQPQPQPQPQTQPQPQPQPQPQQMAAQANPQQQPTMAPQVWNQPPQHQHHAQAWDELAV